MNIGPLVAILKMNRTELEQIVARVKEVLRSRGPSTESIEGNKGQGEEEIGDLLASRKKVAEELRNFLKLQDLAELAKQLGTNEQALRRVLRGEQGLSEEMLRSLNTLVHDGPWPMLYLKDVDIHLWSTVSRDLFDDANPTTLFVLTEKALPLETSSLMQHTFVSSLSRDSHPVRLVYIFPRGGDAQNSYIKWRTELEFFSIKGSVTSFATNSRESSDARDDIEATVSLQHRSSPLSSFRFAANTILAEKLVSGRLQWTGFSSFPITDAAARLIQSQVGSETHPATLWSRIDEKDLKTLVTDIDGLRRRYPDEDRIFTNFNIESIGVERVIRPFTPPISGNSEEQTRNSK